MQKKSWSKILAWVVATVVALAIVGGFIFSRVYNKQFIDLTYRYDRAILRLPDGTVVSGRVESWTDYADGDQIQVRIDGVTYLVHSSMVALIND